MDTNKNIYQRIFDAKKYIASSSTKKAGRNTFSKYEYFTPEQIESLVISACEKNGIDFHFSLLQDSIGLYGKVTVVNLDNPTEQVNYELRTEVPEIKATNRTQQYGGAMTYCRRYMLQNIFSIVDNELDFDNEHSPVYSNSDKPKTESNGNSCITESQVKLFWARANQYGFNKDDVNTALQARNLKSVADIPKSDFNGWLERMEKGAKSKQ